MTHTADQAYLNTRVAVMSTQLFTQDLKERLPQMQLPALAERFGLTAILDDGASTIARSRAVEQGLLQALLAELQILQRPMNATQRDLLLAWGRKYALYNLKTLLRGKLYNLDQGEIRDNLFELPESIRLPHHQLDRAENALELLRQLESGPYRQIARQAREVFEQAREPFALESAIDQRYYSDLARQILSFDSHDQGSLRRLLGAELDRIALLWLLRFKFSYQLSPSETYYQLVPSISLLNRDRLAKLVNLETFELVLEALPEPLGTLLAGSRSVAEVQLRVSHYAADETRWILTFSQSAVARALAYLMLRESDLLMLFAVVQARLLGFSDETIAVALELAEPDCFWSGVKAA